jgi:hypothetical protein
MAKGPTHRGEQRYRLNQSRVGVGGREDGVEDGPQVQGIDGRGAGRGDDGSGLRNSGIVLRKRSANISTCLVMVRGRSYPFFTPSICKSIHQIPGMPKMHHNDAFLPSTPMGIHCSTRKYDNAKTRSRGTRDIKRKMWNGRAIPAGSVGIGRKGAMPEPEVELVSLHGILRRMLMQTKRTFVPELGELLHVGSTGYRAAIPKRRLRALGVRRATDKRVQHGRSGVRLMPEDHLFCAPRWTMESTRANDRYIGEGERKMYLVGRWHLETSERMHRTAEFVGLFRDCTLETGQPSRRDQQTYRVW